MPGYRFYPTEEELVSFYLLKKIQGRRQEDINQVIPELNIYEFNPTDLPRERCPADREQWFFFVPRQEREVRGGRPNRLTTSGFWKATGSPGYVYSSDNRIIGAKRTMVFYKGRAPTGTKTEWKMNEYRAVDEESASPSPSTPPKLREEFSLCRVYIRSKCLRAFDRRPSSSSSSSSAAAVSGTSTATVNQANDDHDIDHDWAATTYHDHYQNDHPVMERTITTSPDLSSSRDHASPNYSQTFNQAHDHQNVYHDWAATTYHDHLQNNHPMMERLITTSPDQSSSEANANPNSQTFNQADHDHHNFYHDWAAAATYHDHLQNDHPMMERLITTSPDQSSTRDHANPNCDMGFDNNGDLRDFWEQLNLL
ncbi:hypothetical protein RHSIM_Rhsim03G0070100 [Rhododendron simsii]|uniref:NAC domain-containing protein n=1 Tax=Rhododendron simsii TaxID=118357 RepID=A0A834HDC5_RHOSS|nr:hypothetical protein RHSIM_Rhsim03G0070100 [Rhododendron simsii]